MVAGRLPRCSEVADFTRRLAVALAPLRELLLQECLEVAGLYARTVREIVVASFGEPSEEREGDGHPTLLMMTYRCIGEDGGERVVSVEVVEGECGVFLVSLVESGGGG